MRAWVSLLVVALAVVAVLDFRADRRRMRAGAPAPEPRVFAHYMPWFRAEVMPDGRIEWDHWQWFGKGPKHDPDDVRENGRRDIASVFYPRIGPYHGRDPKVLEYHLLSARAAGIEGFVADWYGPGSYTDAVFGDLVQAAERIGMKVAICLEEKAFFPGYARVATRAEVLDEMARQIRHVLDTHARSPAYLHRNLRPVLFMFNGFGDSEVGPLSLSPDELDAVLDRFPGTRPLLVRGHFHEAYAAVTGASYAWCGDATYRREFYAQAGDARRRGALDYVVGVASPGFDDSGVNGWGRGPRVTERRGTQEYEDNWNDVVEARPDAVQIVTWNDFQEGTTIEPTDEYGFTLLDLTERYVRDFAGRPSSFEDNRYGYRLYRVREGLEQAADREAARRLGRRADEWVDDFLAGQRWLLGWRLARLEHAAGRLAKKPGAGVPAPSVAGQADDVGMSKEAGE